MTQPLRMRPESMTPSSRSDSSITSCSFCCCSSSSLSITHPPKNDAGCFHRRTPDDSSESTRTSDGLPELPPFVHFQSRSGMYREYQLHLPPWNGSPAQW